MRLYHYTTIGALAQILANRTIRFTRLDQLDDFHEVGIYDSDVTKLVFVSCWVGTPEESIPQWTLYGGNKRGVMISLEQKYIDFPEHIKIFEKDEIAYGIMKNLITNNKAFKVEYVDLDELKKRAKDKVKVNEAGSTDVFGQMGNIKSTYWAFQQEYRYAITVIKLPKHISHDTMDMISAIIPPENLTYVDLPLKPDFQQNLEIVLGPLCSESDKITVEALLHKYNISKNLKDSILKGIILK